MPTQTPVFLGFHVDSLKMEFRLPEVKISKIMEKIMSALLQARMSVRDVASVVGNLQAGARALGAQVVRVCT